MTAEEATPIQAGALARGGEVFVLDMQEPLRIADMARKMIGLMGYRVCDSCEQENVTAKIVFSSSSRDFDKVRNYSSY